MSGAVFTRRTRAQPGCRVTVHHSSAAAVCTLHAISSMCTPPTTRHRRAAHARCTGANSTLQNMCWTPTHAARTSEWHRAPTPNCAQLVQTLARCVLASEENAAHVHVLSHPTHELWGLSSSRYELSSSCLLSASLWEWVGECVCGVRTREREGGRLGERGASSGTARQQAQDDIIPLGGQNALYPHTCTPPVATTHNHTSRTPYKHTHTVCARPPPPPRLQAARPHTTHHMHHLLLAFAGTYDHSARAHSHHVSTNCNYTVVRACCRIQLPHPPRALHGCAAVTPCR